MGWQLGGTTPHSARRRYIDSRSCLLYTSLYTQDGEVYPSAAPVTEIKALRKESKEIAAFTVVNDYHIDSLLADRLLR